MAYTDTLPATRVFIMIGDGATPTEAFTPMCGLSTKGLQQTRATSDTTDWDCADPDAVPITVRTPGATDWSISGSGLLHRPLLATVQDAYESSAPTNFRLVYDEETGSEVIDGYYQGPGLITDFNQGAVNGEFVTIDLTITAAGPLEFVANT